MKLGFYNLTKEKTSRREQECFAYPLELVYTHQLLPKGQNEEHLMKLTVALSLYSEEATVGNSSPFIWDDNNPNRSSSSEFKFTADDKPNKTYDPKRTQLFSLVISELETRQIHSSHVI